MPHTRLGNREGGAILIVTLLFLVILTMLGITAITGTTMEERMAGNTRDSAIALQAAEAALRDARRDIMNIPVRAGFGRSIPMRASFFGKEDVAGTCSDGDDERGLCLPATNPDRTTYAKAPGSVMPATPKHDMRASPSVEYGAITGATAIGGDAAPRAIAVQPRYIIEAFCLMQHGDTLQPFCNFYRITARGYGRNPNSQVTLQETFVSL